MQVTLPTGCEDSLIWWPERGMGFHPRPAMDYTTSYWEEFRQRDASPMGELLTEARLALVRRHYSGQVVDIGIGGGRFVEYAAAQGYDVNAEANEWLRQRDAYCDPYSRPVDAITCWDSLEHIPDPAALLAQVREWAFIAIPIFEEGDGVPASRHYKPGEHIWYFSHRGLVDWMKAHGFVCMEHNDAETELGREGIRSYAFMRVK